MSLDLDALAAQLEREVAAIPGVEMVYARHGFFPIALDIIARVAPTSEPVRRVAVVEREGRLHAEVTVGVTTGTSSIGTAQQVRERISRVLAEARPGPAHVVVRVATVG